MQFGAPTLTSSSSSIPEVAGSAAILLDPQATEDWAQTMLRIAADGEKRDHLGRAALAQSERFDWEQSAGALLSLYEEAIATPKRGAEQ